jgi:catalase (peroxidase I)
MALPESYLNSTLLATEFDRAKVIIRDMIVTQKVSAPRVVRLAWHDSGTYCTHCSRKGGPHAVMRFPAQGDDPANSGLQTARGPIDVAYYENGFEGTITLADFWQFAAVVAIEFMEGPHIPFRPGRENWGENQVTPWDRLPAADFGFPKFDLTTHYMRDIFYRMGFNDYEIVVLLGAHTLGECHIEWSGFFGPWTPNPMKFDNSFYRELVYDVWQLTPNTRQYFDTTPGMEFLMMLHTDMALINDPDFYRYVEIFADNQAEWFSAFTQVFPKLQELGCSNLLPPIPW